MHVDEASVSASPVLPVGRGRSVGEYERREASVHVVSIRRLQLEVAVLAESVPVIVSMGDLGASGGYYVAAAGSAVVVWGLARARENEVAGSTVRATS